MSGKNTSTSNGLGVTNVLLIIFIVLKLVGVINWSWWVVLIPLWINLAVIIMCLAVIGAALLCKNIK